MSDKFFVGYDLTGFSDNGEQKPISRVTLLLDDENYLTAGDDSGMTLEADCPHATQSMVNAILAKVKGKTYSMFSAENARLDPAAELGDGVTAGRVYSVISRLSDDGNVFPGITAPGQAELEDEYPAGGPMTQEFNRKVAETRSQIKKTSEEILLEVKRVEDDLEQFGTDVRIRLDGITTRVSDAEGNISILQQTSTSLESTIRSVSGAVSSIQQKVNNISFKVRGSLGSEASITLTVGDDVFDEDLDLSNVRQSFANDNSAITISAGRVTFNSGTFVLNSGNISIDADGNLTTENGTIKGATITGSTLTSESNNTKTVIEEGLSKYYYYGNFIGQLGSNAFTTDNSVTGISFNLEGSSQFLSWSAKLPGYSFYNVKMTYTNRRITNLGSIFSADTMHFDCDAFMRNNLKFGIDPDDPYGKIYRGTRTISGSGTERGLNIDGANFIRFTASSIVGINALSLNLENTPIMTDSDVRLKTNIEESEIDALRVINGIKTYSFDWIETGEHRNLGFISQQLDAEASSDFVSYDESDDAYRVKEMFLIPYLVKAVQQLYNMVVPQPMSIAEKTQEKKWTPYQYTEAEKLAYVARMQEIRKEQTTFVPPEPIVLQG